MKTHTAMDHDSPRSIGATEADGRHAHPHGPTPHEAVTRRSLNRTALSATLHCLSGCSIGEVLGMIAGTAAGWGTAATLVLAVVLAFLFGYLLTMLPLLRAGLPLRRAVATALAADTVSIIVMEVVDNAVMLLIPGAMAAGLDSPRFWISLALSLVLAGVAAFPVNRWMIARGLGHAVAHAHHH
jgi:hypothetical protein